MASYNVHFKPSVEKDLRRLPKTMMARVLQVLEGLGSDPLRERAIKLSGAERLYRIRVGDYRIIYEVDSRAKEVLVHYIRHRREAYRAL